MFQLLLESNAAHTPRIGGSVWSTIGHAAFVAAAVALTAVPPDRMRDVPEPRVHIFPVVPPPVAPTAPHDPVANSPTFAAAPSGAPTLPIVVDIPVGVQPIDLSRAATRSTDFPLPGRPAGRPDGTGDGNATGSRESGAYSSDQVDKPVLLRPGMPAPSYPERLRSAGIGGIVVVEFVVDTLGTVENGSMRLLQTDHDLFAAAVTRVVPTLRFLPAEAMGRKVRQLVRLPFRFDLLP